MGGFFAKALELITQKKQRRILLLGLKGSGKTTVIYKLKIGDIYQHGHFPHMIGIGIETVEYKSISFTAWDSGFYPKAAPLYRHYYPGTDGIIFMVDSNDKERICHSYCHPDKITTLTFGYITRYLKQTITHPMPLPLYHIISQYAQNEHWSDTTAESQLSKLFNEPQLKSVPLLVFSNKMDLPNVLNIEQVTNCLKLNTICQKDRLWHIERCCASSGDGLYEGLDWLAKTIKNNKRR
eukprot:107394_1